MDNNMRSKYTLEKSWSFEKVSSESDESEYYSQFGDEIDLPHTWNIGENVERGLYLYQKKLNISDDHTDEEVYIEFLGANSVCRAYLNENYLGEHRGGYSTFRFNITGVYDWHGENVLRVFVDNRKTNDVSPLNGDFTIYGGLYRLVNLVCTNKTHFSLDYWGTSGIIVRTELDDDKNGIVNLEVHTKLCGETIAQYIIYDNKERIIKEIKAPAEQRNVKIKIDSPKLWNGKKTPHLFTLKALLEDDSIIHDVVEIHFGFRDCKMLPDKGFHLNGDRLRINGVAKHQDTQTHANAITTYDMQRDIRLIKEIGANAVRLSHYQYDQYIYDLCDKDGLVVWAEIPMLSMPEGEGVMENASKQLKELVLQNIHHPSICFWGIQNEIAIGGESLAMYRGVEQLNDMVRELAPNSISASANMYEVKNTSQLNYITDMQGYNLYFGWYYGEIGDLDKWLDSFYEDNSQVSIGISEYGADCNLAFHADNPKVKDYSEEFQCKYHEDTYQIIESKPYLWGSFVWNMFDFGSSIRNEGGTKGKNCKGLVTFDRNIKKDAYYFYKAHWSKQPFVHICEKRFSNREKENIRIKVYSNLPSVSILLNGREISTIDCDKVFIFENIQLSPGENTVEAMAENCYDNAVFIKVEEPDKSYVFVDPNPNINVKNWFTKEMGEADLFPKNCYSITDALGVLMENQQAWNIIKEKAPAIAERATSGEKVTLLWVINKMKSLTENEVRDINSRLIQIRKTTNEISKI